MLGEEAPFVHYSVRHTDERIRESEARIGDSGMKGVTEKEIPDMVKVIVEAVAPEQTPIPRDGKF
ncbi:MAG: hypothetical protein V1792_16690 [Pseudomonadota bacterium]